MVLAYISSVSHGVWHLRPLPIRAYALCIVAGIQVALALTRRWIARGGTGEQVERVAMWAFFRDRLWPAVSRDHRPGVVLRVW